MVENSVELGEQRPSPHSPFWHLHAEHSLNRQHDAEFVGERGQPVMTIRQHDDLAVVADFEELLGAPMHVADDRFSLDDALAVENQAKSQDTMRCRVLGSDVENHVGGMDATSGAQHPLLGHGAILA